MAGPKNNLTWWKWVWVPIIVVCVPAVGFYLRKETSTPTNQLSSVGPSVSIQGTGNTSQIANSPVQVQNSPGAVVQNAVNSSNVTQIGPITIRGFNRRLTEDDAKILTNKLTVLPKAPVEIVFGMGEGSWRAVEIAEIFRRSGFPYSTRQIAGVMLSPGLHLVDKRPKANRVEVGTSIIKAFDEIGFHIREEQDSNEAIGPKVYIFVGSAD